MIFSKDYVSYLARQTSKHLVAAKTIKTDKPALVDERLATALIEASHREWDSQAIVEYTSRFRWGDNIDRLGQILRTATFGDAAADVSVT